MNSYCDVFTGETHLVCCFVVIEFVDSMFSIYKISLSIKLLCSCIKLVFSDGEAGSPKCLHHPVRI